MTAVPALARRPAARRFEPGFQMLLRLAFVASAFVFIEPAPFDLILLGLLAVTLLRDDLRWPVYVLLPAFAINFLLIGTVASIGWAEDVARALWYAGVTLYLIVSWFMLVALLARYGAAALRALFEGYTVAAVISSIAAIAAFFQVGPGREFLTLNDRPKAFFKDPNVFGPFVIPVVLYSILRFESARTRSERLLWSGVFLLTSFAVLISFSRAAWMNHAVSLVIFLVLKNGVPFRFQTFVRLGGFAAAGMIGLLLMLQIPQVAAFLPQRTGLQDYDSQRFATQSAALEEITEAPMGIGPGQSETFYNHATHSLYLRVANENGLIGAAGFFIFLLFTLGRAIGGAFSSRQQGSGMAALILAVLAGILLNSIVIDTLHWRHLWLICALPWGQYQEEST